MQATRKLITIRSYMISAAISLAFFLILSLTNRVDAEESNSVIKLESNKQAMASVPAPLFSSTDTHQRKLYLQAIQAIEAHHISKAKKLVAKLNDYPLAPHLYFKLITHNSQVLTKPIVNQYENNFPDSPWIPFLNNKWLEKLAKNKEWQALRDNFHLNHKPSESLQCLHAEALIRDDKQSSKDQGYGLAKKLWLTPKSLAKPCDKMVWLVQQSKYIDNDAVMQRLIDAFVINEITLAKYLPRLFKNESAEKSSINAYQALAETLISTHRKPDSFFSKWEELQSQFEKLQQTDRFEKVASKFLKQVVRKHPDTALNWIENFDVGDSRMRRRLVDDTSNYLVTRLALKDYQQLAEVYPRLQKAKVNPSDASHEAYLRALIAQAQWQKLTEAINALPPAIRERERWQYWKLRATQILSPTPETKAQLGSFANNASFYGFSAATMAGTAIPFSPKTREAFSFDQLEKNETAYNTLRIAIEFYLTDNLGLAHSAWQRAKRQYNREYDASLLSLAHAIGWHQRAILDAAELGEWQQYETRFPNAYYETFTYHSLQNGIPQRWAYATARQESALYSAAESPAGALGIMQVLPSTAKAQAKQLNLAFSKERLKSIDFNIAIGTSYLAKMLTRYHSMPLASAAYNAGPARVDRWLKQRADALPTDAWIETIPFSETRQYVQNVMSFALIHEMLYPSSISKASNRTLPAIDYWQVIDAPITRRGGTSH